MDAGSEMDVGGEPRRSSSPVVARSSSKKKDRGDSADAGSPTAARVSVAGSTQYVSTMCHVPSSLLNGCNGVFFASVRLGQGSR